MPESQETLTSTRVTTTLAPHWNPGRVWHVGGVMNRLAFPLIAACALGMAACNQTPTCSPPAVKPAKPTIVRKPALFGRVTSDPRPLDAGGAASAPGITGAHRRRRPAVRDELAHDAVR